jgi:hypothetical protein
MIEDEVHDEKNENLGQNFGDICVETNQMSLAQCQKS